MLDKIELVRTKGVLYDTLFLPENMPHEISNMFVIPLGCYAGGKIKEREHTNMQISGCLPCPEQFGVRGIKCGFYQGGERIDPVWGTLTLQIGLRKIKTFPLSEIWHPSCRSLTYHERHRYVEGFLELEDKDNPIVATIGTMEYFTCILELPKKPDIPTDFLAVIFGDHFVSETSIPPFTDHY
jgi:hypothetical protein